MRNKRKISTLKNKIKVTNQVKKKPKLRKTSTAKRKQDVIKKRLQQAKFNNSKMPNLPSARFSDLEKSLIKWYDQKSTKGISVNSENLKERAIELAQKMKITSQFKASANWLSAFKMRNGIIIYKEPSPINDSILNTLKTDVAPEISKNYKPCDVYSAGIFSMFYNLEPGETCGDEFKDIIFVLLMFNADGSYKSRPMVFITHEQGRCLKGIRRFPVDFEYMKNQDTTQEIFGYLLYELDGRMCEAGRKAILFLERFAIDQFTERLFNTRFKYLSRKRQPLGLGIIDEFKSHYRKMLAEDGNDEDNFSPNVNDLWKAMWFTADSWQAVKPETITDCFKKGRIYKIPKPLDDDEYTDEEDYDSDGDYCDCYYVSDYMHCGNQSQICDYKIKEEIKEGIKEEVIEEIKSEVLEDESESTSVENNSDEDQGENAVDSPSFDEALMAFEKMKSYITSKTGTDSEMKILSDTERLLHSCGTNSMK